MRKGEDLDLQDETLWRASRLKASYALRPKSIARQRRLVNSPRIPRGCLKFGKSRWDSYATGPILFRFPKLPPGGWRGPIAPPSYGKAQYDLGWSIPSPRRRRISGAFARAVGDPVANTSPSRPNDADSANTDNRRMGNDACSRRNRDYSASPKPRRRWNEG
jgi:hypothetical protein